MTRIVVRATDTALAMDEVIERLGPDAFILSTRSEPGGVVIEAASHPIAAVQVQALPSFADELAARMAAAAAAPLPAVPFDAGWLRDVAAELAGQPGARPLAALAPIFAATGAEAAPWPTDRMVLAGPVAEDLDQTAVRLAIAFRQSDAACAPDLLSCLRRGTVQAPGLLAWSRLLGLTHQALSTPVGELAPGDQPKIIVVPADSAVTPQTLIRDAADLLLVLPAGLHPRRLHRLLAPWRGSGAGVCLTGLAADDPPQPEELCALAEAGLQLRLLATDSGLQDALSLVSAEHLPGWAAAWCAEADVTAPDEEAPELPMPAGPRPAQPAQEYLA